MSGTSADGIDAALIETDGNGQVRRRDSLSVSYEPEFSSRIKGVLGEWRPTSTVAELEAELTRLHAGAVERLLVQSGLRRLSVDIVGFHGQTIAHDPARGRTRQIGDGSLLAAMVDIDVVHDFRGADVAAGGEGAPLAPAYHHALAADLPRPMAIINIGGVANVTFLPRDGHPLAFDTGPGNSLVDDWVGSVAGLRYDADGAMAAAGKVDESRVQTWLSEDYFDRPPPKSLDRQDFADVNTVGMRAEDGAATLTAFTARSIARSCDHLPEAPQRWLVTGGGRHNSVLMAMLADALGAPVGPVEDVGWDGDAIEAQAFAYLAVRSRLGAPLTYPETTGVDRPLTGGRLAPRPGRGGDVQAISASRSFR